MRLISAGIQIPRQGSKEGRQSSKSNKSNATLPTHFTFREESDTLSKIIPIILLKTCESNILLPIFNIQSCCPVVQNRNPKTNPNLPSKLYIFHACSTSALENTKQRKEGKQKYIFSFFFFLFYFCPFYLISLSGALSPDTANVVLLVHPGAGSAPCWPRTSWAMRVNFLKVRFESGPKTWAVPTLVSDVHRRMKTLGGDGALKTRRLCILLMHTAGIEPSSYSVHSF